MRSSLALLLVVVGCAKAHPSSARDAGADASPPRDAGTDASRRDAGACAPGCERECAFPDVCVTDARGCRACGQCDRCDPFRCETSCAIDPARGECGCLGEPPLEEGDRCTPFTPPCAADLACTDGICLRACVDDGDCGAFPRCTEGVCDARSGEEWQLCGSDGYCDAGLVCTARGCRRSCETDAECTGAYPHCADHDSDGASECGPALGCDAVHDAGCASDMVCRLALSGDTDVDGMCLEPAAALPAGARCEREMPNTCASGHECLPGPDGFRCFLLCYTDAPACARCAELSGPSGAPLTHHGRGVGACV